MDTKICTNKLALLLSFAVLLAACDTGSGSSGEEGPAECSPPCSIDYTCDDGVCVEKTYGDPSGEEEEPLCSLGLSSYGSSATAKLESTTASCSATAKSYSVSFSGGELTSANGKSCTLDEDASRFASFLSSCYHIYDCGSCTLAIYTLESGDAPKIKIYNGSSLSQGDSCGQSYCCWEYTSTFANEYFCMGYEIDSGGTTIGPGECGSWEPCCEDCYDDCGGNSSYGWDSECYSFCISCCHGCY